MSATAASNLLETWSQRVGLWEEERDLQALAYLADLTDDSAWPGYESDLYEVSDEEED